MTSAIDQARAVADAVLYEGYLLYPYRASAAKNKVRWQWGVLMPPSHTEGGEHPSCRSDLLVEPGEDAALHVRLRFLHLCVRTVFHHDEPVPSATVDGTEYTTFEEAVEREVDAVVRFADLAPGARHHFEIGSSEQVETVSDSVRIVRTCAPLRGTVSLRTEPLPGPFGGVRLTLRVANTSRWRAESATRDDALRHALIGAHCLVWLSGGAFLSLLDPPEWARQAVAANVQDRLWPVLVGAGDQRDTVLCSPIILYDYPTIAEQSAGQTFDGTEIDEILTLRTMTLTDDEKRQARATDSRAADLIDRADNLPPELLDRLHGTVRYLRSVTGEPEPEQPDVPWWDPGADASVAPETDAVLIDGVRVARGSRVRLRPTRRADAHDMFLVGRTALVRAVLLDVDDVWHLAVTLDDDPAADLHDAHGRYRYFGTEEVEPL